MKKLMSMALIVAMGAVACQKEGPDYSDNSTPTNGGYLTFSADFVKLESKAAASFDESSNTLTLAWEEGDQVGIYSGQTPILFTASSAGATTTLTSNIKVASAASYSAVYPYMTDALIEAGSLVMTVPAEQIAKADTPKYHVAVAKTTSNSLAFKNVTAAVRLNLMAENVTKIELKANGGENISGVATVNTSNATVSALANGSSVVTLVPAAGVSTIEPGIYYASVVPQTLSQGFTVTYHVGANTFDQTSEESLSLDGNTLIVCEGFGTAVEGSQSNPFTVGSVEDLKGLSAKLVSDHPNYVVMTKDIDMKDVTSWTPICNSRTVADIPELHFDGRNHTISNFAPTSVTTGTGGDQASIFGILYGSCKNLKMTDVNMKLSGNSTTAPLAGYVGIEGRGELVTIVENVHVSGVVSAKKVVGGLAASVMKAHFKNCTTDVDVTGSDNNVGGFVARPLPSADILFENCSSAGNATCTKDGSKQGRFTGGFFGGDEGTATLKFRNCCATGSVKCAYQVGAFIGYLDAGTIEVANCYATGTITPFSTSKQYGGLVGVNKGNLTITNSYYTGTIQSNKAESVGGIVGLHAAGEATISNCFSTANLSSPTYGVGGIVGYHKGTSLEVTNCYADGTLSAAEKVGAIVGLAEKTSTVKNCKHNTKLNVIGAETVAATQQNNAKISESEAADYATASKVARKLGWSEEVWDLSGTAPTLK